MKDRIRPRFRSLRLALTLLAALGAVVQLVQGEPAPVNILMLLADDARWDSFGFAGNDFVPTPRIDELAREGTVFREAFVTTSICAVSRASIFSGQHRRRHGIVDFKDQFSPAAWQSTYPAVLRSHGYFVGMIGKFGVGRRNLPADEFDFWRGRPGNLSYYKRNGSEHLTRRQADEAIEFLKVAPPDQPFCLSVSFKAPHSQDRALREYPPDPRDETLFESTEPPSLPIDGKAAFDRLPANVQMAEGRVRWERRFATEAMRAANVKDYYRLVAGLDREIGRILDALEEVGRTESTVVIFASDNGCFLGERGLAGKWHFYEESIRIPLVIFDPRTTKQPAESTAMALNIDLAPTILDLAGATIPSQMQGRSLTPMLRGEKPNDWRKAFYYEHDTLPDLIPTSEGVRTNHWAYLRWTSSSPVIEELYDVENDPAELVDLARDPAFAEVLRSLRAECEELRTAAATEGNHR